MMEYFKSGLKSVLGAPEPGNQPSAAETVERLIDRVNNSTLLEDRRDACRALKAMSRSFRVEVGAQGLDALKQVLELDKADSEIISYALDTLNNIMSPVQFEEEEHNPQVPMNIGEQFTEMFIKDEHNVQIILELLDEYDFRVRLSTVILLTSLVTNRPKDIQEIILVRPMGVSKLMDLLSDTREVVRNETLLLLIKLTKGSANIQKIVAFENAFDRLFEIISMEGFADGGIIVEDCLLLMFNLLKNNSSNQNFFKEGSFVQRMIPMFNTSDNNEELGWSPQKVSNIHCMLQLVRTLISPSNSAQIISSCQSVFKNAGLLDNLCNILMASGVPADILTETINCVGEVIRGDVTNQEYFGNVMAPMNPPRPALLVLLMSMVNEKQPLSLRCAVLYCFQCYLWKNPASQQWVVQSLLPTSASAEAESGPSAGQLLCGGLFSSDALSNWFSAVALMHALLHNPTQKEQLLKVLLATNIGSSPVSLLHQCTLLLQQTTKLHTKTGLLMLLCGWCASCPSAVAALLRAPGAVPLLVSHACSNEHDDNDYFLQGICCFLLALCIHFNDDSLQTYTKEGMRQLIVKRIGLETVTAKLAEVSKHEMYNRASKHPQLRAKSPSEILVDYEFCKLFKLLESELVSSFSTAPKENGTSIKPDEASSVGDSNLLEQYKTLIRQQDLRLQELVSQLEKVEQQNRVLQVSLSENQSAYLQLKDENTLLKAQVAASVSASGPALAAPDPDALLAAQQSLHKSEEHNAALEAELERLRKDQDDLLELLADQDVKLANHRMLLLSLGQNIEEETLEDS